MLFNVKTVEDYFKALADDWKRKIVEDIHNLLLELQLQPDIDYKMLCYKWKSNAIFHMNVHPNHVTVFVEKIDLLPSASNLLPDGSFTKDAIRFMEPAEFMKKPFQTFLSEIFELHKTILLPSLS